MHLLPADLIYGLQAACETAAILGKSLADTGTSGEGLDHAGGESELLVHLRENGLAHGLILHELGILACNRHVDLEERALDVVNNETEQARFVEHAPQQVESPLLAHVEKRLDAAAHAVPSGEHVTVLRPGEHPRNRAQILERCRLRAPGWPRSDVEERELLERTRLLQVSEHAGRLHEPAIRRPGRSGKRLHGL